MVLKDTRNAHGGPITKKLVYKELELYPIGNRKPLDSFRKWSNLI